MKKRLFLLPVVVVGTLCLTGCGTNLTTGSMTCTRHATVSEGVEMDLNYFVTYKDGNAVLVETEEKVTTDDKSTLDAYAETVETSYSAYRDVDYYDNSVEVSGNVLTSKTRIDYSKIDTDKLIAIDSSIESIIQDGKVKAKTLKSLYEQIGATCEVNNETER